MFTKYFLIAIAILTVSLSVMTKLWLNTRDDLTVMQVELVLQKKQTEIAIADIKHIKALHQAQNETASLLLNNQRILANEYRKRIQDIQRTVSTNKAAAIKEPARFGRIATYTDRRVSRDVCRASGGSQADCKIDIPKSTNPPKRPPTAVNMEDNDRVGIKGTTGSSAP